jgi:hypothetical protein
VLAYPLPGALTVRAMHRLLVLYPPPSDPDHFRSYYEGTHLPLVAQFPGLRGYRYSFDVAAAEGESPYYCVFERRGRDAPWGSRLCSARTEPEVTGAGPDGLEYRVFSPRRENDSDMVPDVREG